MAADLQSLCGSHLAIDSECGKRALRNPSRTAKAEQAGRQAAAAAAASHAAISEVAGSATTGDRGNVRVGNMWKCV